MQSHGMKLTWNDLIIQNLQPADVEAWIAPWLHLVNGRFSPVFMSKFGDWYLRRADNSIDELSVIEGTLQRVASTPEEFQANVNSVWWQEHHLLSYQVADLHGRGLVPGPGECFGFAPHPIFVGGIDISTARVMSIRVWQSIAAQAFGYSEPNQSGA
jgi:hypothetical protein